jgi:PIN domain nuclease of toxin-antitoxin system
VRLLLDTHVLLWWLADEPLRDDAKRAIADQHNEVFVSAATAWEISIKAALGKLEAPDDLSEQLGANAFAPLGIAIPHALVAGGLPRHHDDPFDRMLIAQASLEQLVLVTRDARLARYDVEMLAA